MATVSQALYAEWRAQHVAEGIKQGVERGIKQGVERGIKQGVERGIKQGVQRGLEQGVEQECARGLARLRRQAAIKFGARSAERLLALLGTAVTTEQLDRLDRVSDWLVECQQAEDLLSRVAALVGNGTDGH